MARKKERVDRDGNPVKVGDKVLLGDKGESGPVQGKEGTLAHDDGSSISPYIVQFDGHSNWHCDPCDILSLEVTAAVLALNPSRLLPRRGPRY